MIGVLIVFVLYQGTALILGLSDGLAGLIGQKIGRRSYRVTGYKTAEGSFGFFIITTLILGLFGTYGVIREVPSRDVRSHVLQNRNNHFPRMI